MKKSLHILIGSIILAFVFNACGGSGQQLKTGTKPDDKQVQVKADSGGDVAVQAINEQVGGFYITGFRSGSSKIDRNKDLEYMKKIVKLVKPIIDKVPDGYVMEITGHCADYESASEQKKVSEARAKAIYDELKKAGASAKKMTYRGVGTDEPLKGVDGKDPKQRRVSFRAVKN